MDTFLNHGSENSLMSIISDLVSVLLENALIYGFVSNLDKGLCQGRRYGKAREPGDGFNK